MVRYRNGSGLTSSTTSSKTKVYLPPDIHRALALAAELDNSTINDWILGAITSRLGQPRYEAIQRAATSVLPARGNGVH